VGWQEAGSSNLGNFPSSFSILTGWCFLLSPMMLHMQTPWQSIQHHMLALSTAFSKKTPYHLACEQQPIISQPLQVLY
jgi:hypothetical protein